MPYVTQVATGRRERLTVHGDDYDTPDGTGVRDYIHVVDLARAHLAAVGWAGTQGRGCRPFNLGTGRGVTVLELVEAFRAASGHPIPLVIGPRRAGDVAVSYADPRLAELEFGWKAEYGVPRSAPRPGAGPRATPGLRRPRADGRRGLTRPRSALAIRTHLR